MFSVFVGAFARFPGSTDGPGPPDFQSLKAAALENMVEVAAHGEGAGFNRRL